MNITNKGFTLLEVLVSVAILSIIVLAMFSLLKVTITLSSAGAVRIDLYQNMRQALETMSIDIKCAVPAKSGIKDIPIFLFQTELDKIYLSGAAVVNSTSDRLDLVTASSRGSTAKDIIDALKLNYFMADATGLTDNVNYARPRTVEQKLGNSTHLFLIRGPQSNINTLMGDPPVVQPWTDANLPSRAIANNITSVKYTFCDTDMNWIDSWPSSNRYLPAAVKISITASDDNMNEELGKPDEPGSGLPGHLKIRIFQNNAPNNWW